MHISVTAVCLSLCTVTVELRAGREESASRILSMHLLAKSSWGSYLYSLVASTPDLFSKCINLFVLKEINFVF